ncbi:hypothetical protein EBB79_11055 [Parasedimentitalea marina]|uniref:Uncharacterized protein n=1 Tax=Parasedimentitalea marina TaxID=2483033 RepID=A0A3T0N2Z1_9RHOB|nr:hypothetical protein EBB79_11055 [Parasedimentitalea marina]
MWRSTIVGKIEASIAVSNVLSLSGQFPIGLYQVSGILSEYCSLDISSFAPVARNIIVSTSKKQILEVVIVSLQKISFLRICASTDCSI